MVEAALKPEEKAALRLCLQNHMQKSQTSEFIFNYGSFLRSLRMAASGVAGILLIGAVISYAAEGTLPGDVLYPVKVEVNERLLAWTAVSQEAQADWSVERTTRRLEELERLATVGGLDDTLREKIASRFEQNTEEAHKAIVLLKKEQIEVAADTSSRLESSLRVHEKVLIQVAEDRADMSSQIHGILDMVRKKAESISEIRLEIEKEITDAKIRDDPSLTATSSVEETTLQ